MPKTGVPAQAGQKRKAADEVETGNTDQKRSRKGEKVAKKSRSKIVTGEQNPAKANDTPTTDKVVEEGAGEATTPAKQTPTTVSTEGARAEQKRLRKEAKRARRQQAREEKGGQLVNTGSHAAAKDPQPKSAIAETEEQAEPENAGTEDGLATSKKERKKDGKNKRQAGRADAQATDKAALAATRLADNVTAKSSTRQKQDWTFTPPTAGRFLQHDPIFVHDEKGDSFLLAANGHELQVLSLETSLVERVILAPEDCTIRCFCADEANASLVHIVYSDDQIQTWSWLDATGQGPPRSRNGKPVAMTTAIGDDAESAIQFYVSDMGQHSAISSSGGRPGPLFVSKQHLYSLQATERAEYVVAHGSSTVVVGKKRYGAKEGFTWLELPMSMSITCLDTRLLPVKSSSKKGLKQQGLGLAIGNQDGQIHFYEDVSSLFTPKDKPSLPSPRILHWHRNAVSSVSFSRDGNYLISGGKETVLVLWQLETGKKQYLPHLTSEIERIVVSPEGDRYAVQMGDNSIMVLSTSELKPVANFAGLQMPIPVSQKLESAPSSAAILHPLHPDQLLLTVPSTQPKAIEDISTRPFLQTFDIATSRHITRQALTRNNVTDFNLGPERTPIVPPDVQHIAISCDGQWLATVEDWTPPASDMEYLAGDELSLQGEQEKRREVYLKIWSRDEAQSLWTLSTRIDAPHARAFSMNQGAGKVFTLVADPTSSGFATVGEDSCVKLWGPKSRKRHGVAMKGKEDAELVDWICKGVVELEHEPEDAGSDSGLDVSELFGPTGGCLAFSDDGSMLAASMLYDGIEEAPLVHFIRLEDHGVTSRDGLAGFDLLDFGFLDRYFIALSRKAVRVWDLVSDQLQYHLKLPLPPTDTEEHRLAISHSDGTFTVAKAKMKESPAVIEVYGPQKPKCIHKEVLETSLACVLASSSNRGYTLLFTDATVRTLVASGTTQKLAPPELEPQAGLSTINEVNGTEAIDRWAQDVEMSDLVTAIAPASGDTFGLMPEDSEDDRPVVRPEQLASIFDIGQSFAMPPVRDMLQAVVGLYSRIARPREAAEQAGSTS